MVYCAVHLRSTTWNEHVPIDHVDCMSRVARNVAPIHQRTTTDKLHAIVVGSKVEILSTACELAQITNAMCFSMRFRRTRFSTVLQLPRIMWTLGNVRRTLTRKTRVPSITSIRTPCTTYPATNGQHLRDVVPQVPMSASFDTSLCCAVRCIFCHGHADANECS